MKQEELLTDLYAFTDKWLARIYSPYWSKIYMYEINREALGIIGNVYVAYQQPFQGTVTSNCGINCSEYLIQPPAPIGKVIPKEMQGNDCPFKGNKLSLGIGFCGVILIAKVLKQVVLPGLQCQQNIIIKKKALHYL